MKIDGEVKVPFSSHQSDIVVLEVAHFKDGIIEKPFSRYSKSDSQRVKRAKVQFIFA
jgi:hypothetical protein